MRKVCISCVLLLVVTIIPNISAAETTAGIPTPESYFGFTPGSDRQLMDYGQLVGYMQQLADTSPRIEMRDVGMSPLGRTMYVAFISAGENIEKLDELREINRRLAIDPDLAMDDRVELIENGRVFVLETLSMHSGEVAPSQSLPIFAHRMATTDDPLVITQLQDVVQMMLVCHNPDGMDMVVEHYREYVGTKYEGSRLPQVYHKYVGHDNNRDFVALTQEDTRVIARIYSTEWYPQVMVEKHQMGSTGPRYYVPPNHDPIAQNIDEGLWNWSAIFGANLSRDMTADGLQGVASHWVFDDYWPGSTETSHWKNIISFLTEAASCKTATPIFIEPTELSVRGKGLSEYKKGVNMPDPWPGGTWSLGNIVEFELSSMQSILATASRHREQILTFRNDLCRKEVEKGRNEAPFYYVMPQNQHDPSELAALVELLNRHGVQVSRLTGDAVVGDLHFAAGDIVVPLSQPYRPFVKEMLEKQVYPERHYTPGGELIRPYDITSWSLPLHMGVRAIEVDQRSQPLEALLQRVADDEFAVDVALADGDNTVVLPPSNNQSYKTVFAALKSGLPVGRLSSALSVAASNQVLAAGSFVVGGAGVSQKKLGALVDGIKVKPTYVGAELSGDIAALAMPRIALVETFFHDMDAGWTRYLFDTYGLPFKVLNPADFDNADLAGSFDVIVFPDASKDVLTKGKYKRGDRYVANDFPPEFRRPISKEGLSKITGFIEGGGTVVSWGGSTALFTDGLAAADGSKDETVELPVRDVSKSLGDEVLVPGAFLAVDYLAGHPLTWGMPEQGGAFSRGKPSFMTSIPTLGMDRRVIATYPERNLLQSGYLTGEKKLQNKAVMVWVKAGEGQLVLFGIRPQFRGSTPATFKLVFNALLMPSVTE